MRPGRGARRSTSLPSLLLGAEPARQPTVSVPEEEPEHGQENTGHTGKSRLECDVIRHPAAAVDGGERSLVHPAALAQHRRRLEEADAALDADEREVVPVDRDDP